MREKNSVFPSRLLNQPCYNVWSKDTQQGPVWALLPSEPCCEAFCCQHKERSFQEGSSRHTRKVKSCPPGAGLSLFQHCTHGKESPQSLQHPSALPSPALPAPVSLIPSSSRSRTLPAHFPTLFLLMGTSVGNSQISSAGGRLNKRGRFSLGCFMGVTTSLTKKIKFKTKSTFH